MTEISLPKWDELPELELYMDQVVVLINKYLGEYTENAVTPSMINNYVKLKALPAPNKKRYNRIHLSYLLMICILKYTLSIPQIQKIIKIYETEEEVKELYNNFRKSCKNSALAFAEQTVKNGSDFETIISGAVTSGLIKRFTEEFIEKY